MRPAARPVGQFKGDTVDRVNADAPLNYLLDPIRDRLAAGRSVQLLSLALAAWLRRVRGVDELGGDIEVRHPLADTLQTRAIAGGPDPTPLLQMTELFSDLGRSSVLVESTSHWLEQLYQVGAARTVQQAVFQSF